MSEDLYHRIRYAQQDGMPSGELAPLVKELEEATGDKAPQVLAQKRSYLTNWADDQQDKFSEPPYREPAPAPPPAPAPAAPAAAPKRAPSPKNSSRKNSARASARSSSSKVSAGGGAPSEEQFKSPPKGKSKVMNSPPANAPPPMRAATPPEQQKTVMDRETLMRTLYDLHGRQIPASQLGNLSGAIQALNPDGPKAPSTVNQKRTFVEDWWKEHADPSRTRA